MSMLVATAKQEAESNMLLLTPRLYSISIQGSSSLKEFCTEVSVCVVVCWDNGSPYSYMPIPMFTLAGEGFITFSCA